MSELPSTVSVRRFVGWEVILTLFILLWLNYLATDNLTASFLPTDFLFDDEDLSWIVWLGLLAVFPLIATVLWLVRQMAALRLVAMVACGVFFFAVICNAVWIFWTLTDRAGSEAYDLLFDAGIVWISNVIVFTAWYWLLDAGGPAVRGSAQQGRRDFLFPPQANPCDDWPNWHPNYVDYLFLSFCSCTAFSPADTATLSRRAKLFQMAQAAVSLLVLAMIAARAINIIETASQAAT